MQLLGGTLVIGANHPQWLQALKYNRTQLLGTLRAAGHKIKDIRIQQHHPDLITRKEDTQDQESIWSRHPSRIDVHGIANCDSCGSPAPAGEMALWGMCGFCRRQNILSINKMSSLNNQT